MTFNSLEFLAFFPIVTVVFFLTPVRWRWMLLLAASYYFYMCWRPEFVLLLMASTGVSYYAGLRMSRLPHQRDRKGFLALSVLIHLGLLFAFRYLDFFNGALSDALRPFNIFYNVPFSQWLVPVGISFFTLQSIAYTVDVYRGERGAEKHLGIFALFIAFFPKVMAGPIERAGHLLPQFREKQRFEEYRVVDGLRLMLWGLFKKIVIADRLAFLVDRVYAHPVDYYGLTLTVATVFFAFQIYCDFSGYCDIAIGAARVMGFRLTKNFDRPYLSHSIPEFWRRWHISLYAWFRDYVYIPLGGKRRMWASWMLNIMITFMISGLWYGAKWTFVLWGGLHGVYYLLAKGTLSVQGKIIRILGGRETPTLLHVCQSVGTFALVCFSWIFFRARNLDDAFYVARHIFEDWNKALTFGNAFGAVGISYREYLFSWGLIIFLIVIQLLEGRKGFCRLVGRMPVVVRWVFCLGMTLMIMNTGVIQDIPFIFYQF